MLIPARSMIKAGHRGTTIMTDTLDADLDLDEMLGLDILFIPETREQRLINIIHTPKNPLNFGGYASFLKNRLAEYEYYHTNGMRFAHNTIKNAVAGQHPLSRAEYARYVTEFYLLKAFGSRFDPSYGLDKREICDLATVTNVLLEKDEIKNIIAKKHSMAY